MDSRFFSEYFSSLNNINETWWNNFKLENTAITSPLTQALNDLTLKDSQKLIEGTWSKPDSLTKIQMEWWESQMAIWQEVITYDKKTSPVIQPDKGDKRFLDPAWDNDAFYNCIKQSYLLLNNKIQQAINDIDGVDDKVKERLSFFSRQALNALSPTNFLMTNPELTRLTIEQDGVNLVNGLKLLEQDIESSADVLRIRMTNKEAFQVGKDLANTEGKVVFKNYLFELIQYKSLTAKVNVTPLLIIPPFINKYYILDLREKNSMVRWLLQQGHAVFMISWRNPDASMKDIDFADYIIDGVIKATEVVEDITKAKKINAVGYCIGGTLLAASQAYMIAKRIRNRIKTATYFTTLLDFSQPGEIGAYINNEMISAIEQSNAQKGYMDGRSLSVTFSLLKENSLYWNYYVNNYLKGNNPIDFDLLYWNGDSTNVTEKCHSTLLRSLYLNNKLIDPKGLKINDVYLDLTKIKVPSYFISAQEDHLALWKSTYCGALNLSGKNTFVLGESGHIAGIVNHPDRQKYGYWINDTISKTPESWFDKANHQTGSWWIHWNDWLKKQETAKPILANRFGSKNNPVLGNAPGVYVLQGLPIVQETI
ncbi:class I poly(R)-hydroxyalkanoic acid synthase [Photobacterium kishitanii]|uniref:class I poly(R)-hydroxyalkanoic acid synthase n=1 Tax=Photobacterium kishitanii TaxID=318456 RepID=UPI000D16FE55|nr:class I poly(R)-hydroxyalkanoic acid synthase [Photobacterium kishitanii]PSW60872.1 class I poly(R)-hydroxyalkanoic acid synthase [Photobacterium kishitanii]